jgi:allantoinase
VSADESTHTRQKGATAPEYDLVVAGGTVVTTQGGQPRDIAISDGRIQALVAPGTPLPARRRVDARRLHVLPGLIDPHVHLRDPGVPERETFTSGTAAAASGGVTTVLEMPISHPGVHNAAVLQRRAELASERAVVDFGLYAGAGQENLDQLDSLAQAGAVAFKTFLHPPAAGREEEFRGLWCADYGELYQALRRGAETGLPHAVHCEDGSLEQALRRQHVAAGQLSGPAHGWSRPPLLENVAVAAAVEIAEAVRARLHVVHISSPQAIESVLAGRRRGVRVTMEACPNHLFLDEEDLLRHGPFAKCNPPPRNRDIVAELWRRLRSGQIDVIGSDHAPFTEAEKNVGHADIFRAAPGIPAVELTLPLLLTAVAAGRLTLTELVRLTSAQPAELFGLARKGRIAVGQDADLALVDLEARWSFDAARSLSRSGSNLRAYQGRTMVGAVRGTLVRGVTVFQDGAIQVGAGHGQWVRPEPAAAATEGAPCPASSV